MASETPEPDIVYVPLAGTRTQSMQRLQFGLVGLGVMVLLVGVANVIVDRVKQTDASSVPEAAATLAPSPSPVANDPLADAGLAPEVAVSPAPKGTARPTDQGN